MTAVPSQFKEGVLVQRSWMQRKGRTEVKIANKTVAVALGAALTTTFSYASDGVLPGNAIRHVVVIFQENVSFDHYFATYPHALNPPGEPAFTALPATLAVQGFSGALLTGNPTFWNVENGLGRANPFRLRRDQVAPADQSHN